MKAIIEFDKPHGTNRDEIAQFIRDALSSWGGGFHPEDPLFHSLTLTGLLVGNKRYPCETSDDDPDEAD